MKIETFIKDNSILIIPNNLKKKFLLKLNHIDKIYNIKIMSLKEFISSLTFSYNEQAIYYLMTKYNIKYLVATAYLENIRYVEIKDYSNQKLNKLVNIKQELLDNNLLIFDELFKELIKNKNIIIYGYDYISKYDMNILKDVENIEIIKKKNDDYNHDVFEFNRIDDEVDFVANKICELIKNGVSYNKIKLSNVSSEYYSVIKRIFGFYNINVNLNNENSIYSTNICKEFLMLLSNNNLEIILDELKNKFNMKNDNNLNIYNSIIGVLNKYNFVKDYSLIKDILIEEFKKIKIKVKNEKESIEIIDIKDNIIDDDEYVFLVGFNQTIIPKIYKDEDYLSDIEKELLNLEKSYEKNNIEKNIIISAIKNIKNLIISYKLSTTSEIYYPSMLISEFNFNVIKNIDDNFKNSNLSNKIKLAGKLDKYIKYGESDNSLGLLYSNYKTINYNKFDNKYKQIDNSKVLNYIGNEIKLSYTNMDNYYKCSYKYYLDNILKLNSYEETFATIIGNLFHYVLSKAFDKDFNFEEEFNNFISKYEFNFKEQFYINKLKEDLIFIIKTIKKQYTHSSFKNSLYEEEIVITNETNNVKLTFKGFIDKLLYMEENNNTYVVIIDYKTGNPELNLNNCIYGINMQLPVYLYLAKNSDKIRNAKVIGFYLQKILLSGFNIEKNKTYKMLKEDSLKLQGYTIDKEYLIEKIDDTYENSEVIKSLKMTSNGFYAYSKIINEDKINKLINLTNKKIDEAFNDIKNAKFDINPKKIGFKNVSCEFCNYKDICYKKEEDLVILPEYKNLEFLK